jgi:hypothetical protein
VIKNALPKIDNINDVINRIRVGRSIQGFGLSPGITKQQRIDVEKLAGSALSKLTGKPPSMTGMSNWRPAGRMRPLCVFCVAQIMIFNMLQINYFYFLPIISLC